MRPFVQVYVEHLSWQHSSAEQETPQCLVVQTGLSNLGGGASVGCTGWVAGAARHVVPLLAGACVAARGVCADRVGTAWVCGSGALVLVQTAFGLGASREVARHRGEL